MPPKTKAQRLARALDRIGFSAKERAAVMAFLAGQSYAQASVAAGYHKSTVGHKMAGSRGNSFRERFEAALDVVGLGYQEMAEKMTELMEATKPYFNRETGIFELFADNDVRLRSIDCWRGSAAPTTRKARPRPARRSS